jgi:hypothetical protein
MGIKYADMILYIDEERDDRSFIMGAEIVSWG